MTRLAATHELRSPTGLDRGGRAVILRALAEAGISAAAVVGSFMRDGSYADIRDYLHGVEEVHGTAVGMQIVETMRAAASERESITALNWEADQARAADVGHPIGLLLSMPTRDFLTAVENGIQLAADSNARAGGLASEINRICETRGIPYRMTTSLPPEFEWTGDAEVQQNVLAPALSALDDPRLRGGAKEEYDDARRERRENTPESRKHAVSSCCNSIESAMEVLCEEHKITVPSPANAQPLFEALLNDGDDLVTRENEEMVLGPTRFGNRRGRHGGGRVTQEVRKDEVDQVLAATATSLAYLAKQLP